MAKGDPISVQAFRGNNNDLSTFYEQLIKINTRFNINSVVIVGDKGMIKKTQMQQIQEYGFDYITSITKAQIKTLINNKVLQLNLFEDELLDTEYDNNRYILRRNPIRQQEMRINREQRIEVISNSIIKANAYLAEHKRAKTQTQIKYINNKIAKLKLTSFLSIISQDNRTISIQINQHSLQETTKLDGCYVIKTSLAKKDADANTIDNRYKDLSKVEYAFKNIKTEQLEVRPIHLRNEQRTRGHIFVCMLAYKLIRYIRLATKNLDITLKDVLDNLSNINYIVYDIKGVKIKQLPTNISKKQQDILNALDITLPKIV